MKSLKNLQENEILIAGKDYPRTYREFVTMFLDDKSCREFLYKLRWNDGFVCPKCEVFSTPWEQTHKRLVCPNCRHQTTFKELSEIDWGNAHNNNINVDDIVYIYITKPLQKIAIKAIVTKSDFNENELLNNDGQFNRSDELRSRENILD